MRKNFFYFHCQKKMNGKVFKNRYNRNDAGACFVYVEY